MKAKISEIFSSIQGEGIYTGIKQVFVRFYGCNLHCEFCDTKINDYTLCSTDEIVKIIDDLFQDHHSISITGAEPLLQVEFLHELIPLLKERDYLIYLETNGTLAEEFNEIKELIDIVAMDIKLPSSARCGSYWQEHENFLKYATDSDADLFIKSVICSSTTEKDLTQACELVSKFNKDIPFVLQPSFHESGLEDKSNKFKEMASKHLSDVRIMRQEHKFLGVK